MIKPEQIPDEVVEELHSLDAWRGSASEARAAIAAALAAWPNKESLNKPGDWGRYIVLPLTQEARDD